MIERPNILLVFADQMRGMDMGCAGNRDVRTPNLDRLAAEGTRFARAYANAPVCGPSRATLLTGQYPLTHRVVANDLPLPEEAVTLGDLLAGSGYRTGYIGKWHLDGVPRDGFTPPGKRRHGFAYWAAYNCSHNYLPVTRYYRDDPAPVEVKGYEPAVQTDLALDFLSAGDARPFCLILSYGPPHDPYGVVPEEFARMYDPAVLTLRRNVRALYGGAASLARGMECRGTLAGYYAAVSALDKQVGRLVDGLDRSGQAESTILIFTSDHGDMLWSQGRMKKQQPFEESISVPLIVRQPGTVAAGVTNNTLLGTVDVAPSLLAMAGIERPSALQGRDLSGAMSGSAAEGPESVFLMEIVPVDEGRRQGIPPWRGVRTLRFTFARPRSGPGALLYDNADDPYQLVNRADDPDYSETRRELEGHLDGWLRRGGDEFLSGEEHLRRLGLVDLWNARERALDPEGAQIL